MAHGTRIDNGAMAIALTSAPTDHPEARAARLEMPPRAADCHVHVFGPRARFPYAPTLSQPPAEAPKEALFALHRRFGIERCVVVQSVVHGFDNRAVEDVLRSAPGRYLGIALVPLDIPSSELARLAALGFRGVRFNFMKHLQPQVPMAEVMAFSRRLEPHRMHLQVHCEADLLPELAPLLARSPVPVVIDHMGRVDARRGARQAPFVALQELLQRPDSNVWVKVSGIDRIDANEGPVDGYRAGVALARQLVAEHPDRCVWGSDWPHPNHTHVPDDTVLVEALAAIAPAAEQRSRLLVDNPQALYQFAT